MRKASESTAEAPLVSVGVPVFNGEAFLEDAIRSTLGQTLDDLELILCDNASEDRTAEICRDYAARDPRVRYFRNPRNLGAAANYNLAFSHARGRYFKWLAHDDRMLTSFLAKTSRLLEERPDVVLCNTVISYIDSAGAQIGLYNTALSGADSFSPSARFAWMVLRSHTCADFFGLIRREALHGSLLHGSFHGADRALLAQLALRGRLAQLPAPLLAIREHPGRYTRAQGRSSERAAWHDSARPHRASFPTWRLYREYLTMVAREALRPEERSRCYGVLARWWGHNWNAVRAAVDLVAVAMPGAPAQAERLKTRLFGAAPGHLHLNRPATLTMPRARSVADEASEMRERA
ncbi:MAG TPA: glycosyltransferase family 2 protein [Steroidobacteraceae bacterium]|nr:glycosyltransferase family 2 protein [Steroidobacteraceae bacterium]